MNHQLARKPGGRVGPAGTAIGVVNTGTNAAISVNISIAQISSQKIASSATLSKVDFSFGCLRSYMALRHIPRPAHANWPSLTATKGFALELAVGPKSKKDRTTRTMTGKR